MCAIPKSPEKQDLKNVNSLDCHSWPTSTYHQLKVKQFRFVHLHCTVTNFSLSQTVRTECALLLHFTTNAYALQCKIFRKNTLLKARLKMRQKNGALVQLTFSVP